MEYLSERTQEILKAAVVTDLTELIGAHASDIFRWLRSRLLKSGNQDITFEEMQKAAEEGKPLKQVHTRNRAQVEAGRGHAQTGRI